MNMSEPVSGGLNAPNMPIDMTAGPKPIAIPQRQTVITSKYNASIHEDLSARVQECGNDIESNDEKLTIRLLPPERRFAVGPCVNGVAQLIPQKDFEEVHETWWKEQFIVLGASPPQASLRPIPNIKDFIQVKLNPYDSTKIIPLGQSADGTELDISVETKKPDAYYDSGSDKMIDRKIVEDSKDTEIAELKAQLESLKDEVRNADFPAIPDSVDFSTASAVVLKQYALEKCKDESIRRSWVNGANKDDLKHFLATGEVPQKKE